MGNDFRHICLGEMRRLVWLLGLVFAVVLMIQHFFFPYGDVLSSLFSAGKDPAGTFPSGNVFGNLSLQGNQTFSNHINSTRTSFVHEVANITKLSDGKEENVTNDFLSVNSEDIDDALTDVDPEDESPSKDFFEVNWNTTLENSGENNSSTLNKTTESEYHLPTSNDTRNGHFMANIAPAPGKDEAIETSLANPSVSLPLSGSLPQTAFPPDRDSISRLQEESTNHSTSSVGKVVANKLNNEDVVETRNSPVTSYSPISNLPAAKKMDAVVSISEMNDMLRQSTNTYRSMKPRWSSTADQELLHSKYLIEKAPLIGNDYGLYAPLYRNISMFKRSYELMEQTLKVYIYAEGARPIFHQPVLKGIYASEGWFMKLLKANKQYVTKDPKKAHLFYLPFSSRMLEETLYVPDSHSRKNLVQYLSNYLDLITSRHRFWNRTSGGDHFLVACHDWAPAETKRIMAKCIRALCNADLKEGFQFGRDVSLPETFVRSPQKPLRELGGKHPSQRRILAFFAGNMHGYLRPILLQYWENKDPDMKIFGRMAKVKGQMSYAQYMKSSKYCICAKGYEVNSPRVVEAIFYECVPVIISDNFVPPFFETLNWESFAVFVLEKDIPNLKNILLSIPKEKYLDMQMAVKQVQQHFLWHARPVKFDIFHMILHSIWHSRVFGARPP